MCDEHLYGSRGVPCEASATAGGHEDEAIHCDDATMASYRGAGVEREPEEAQRMPEPAPVEPGSVERASEEDGRKKSASELTPHELGREGERLAAAYLERRGLEILERNWRCSYGEADIIARDGDVTVLVEVKTRLALGERSEEMPELAVNAEKRRRYRSLAAAYLAAHPFAEDLRFDVIAINVVGDSSARLRHLVGAYCLDD